MDLQLFADNSGSTSTDNSTTVLTSTTNPMEGWIKGDVHCFVTNENNFLLVRLLSLLDDAMSMNNITYNEDGGINSCSTEFGNVKCIYDTNNLLTTIDLYGGSNNDKLVEEIKITYDKTTKFISSFKRTKYYCDGQSILLKLDPSFNTYISGRSTFLFDTKKALDSGCYNFSDTNAMFAGAEYARVLDLSNWNTSNVFNMSNMFNQCLNLTTLDVSKWDTSNVTDMNGMFYDCESLTTLDLSNWDTSNVTNMTSMFGSCTSLTTITGVIDMKSCTSYSDMFNNCSKLTGVKIKNPPSGITATSGIGGLAAGKYEIVS